MASAICLKRDAVSKYNNSKIMGTLIFAEDINTNGGKRYSASTPNVVYDKICNPNISKSHFYESWAPEAKMMFGLDRDIPNKTFEESRSIAKNNIIKICDAMTAIHGHSYNVPEIIVLESEPNISIKESGKYSYHVIFRGIIFQNHDVCKDFYIQAHKNYDIEYGDISIYNNTCLRLCYCNKKGKDAIFLPVELDINGEKTMTDLNTTYDADQFFYRTMITFVAPNDRIEIKKSQMVNKIKSDPEPLDKPKNSVDNLNIEGILFSLHYEVCDNYDSWIKVGMCLHHLEGDYFPIWDKWSQQSSKYKKYEMKNRWNQFARSIPINVGYLVNLAKKYGVSNTTIYKNNKLSVNEIIKSYPVKPIKLDIDEHTLVIEQSKLTPETFEPYIHKKLICVQSEKGTGKTSNLLSLMFEKLAIVDENTSMLFVSSRRTFGAKLLGDLKEYGFVLYSDIKGDIREKKLICQVDSLKRIDFDRYDYVIVDECESCARYITSTHFTKNPEASYLVDKLEFYIAQGKQVIAMDADFSDRCLEYYKNVMDITSPTQYQLIVNKFKPYKEYTVTSMTYNDWVQRIIEDLERNYKLAVPMASNNKAKDLVTMIQNQFPEAKVLLIHKETKDEDKVRQLMSVNTTWQEYDVVIYTPSVCMGVSFDIPDYFDCIYAYGCENSLGSQEFAQMIHRVREPKNKVVNMALNLYREYDEMEDVMTFERVEEIICSEYYLTHYDLHSNLTKVKMSMSEPDEDGNSERILTYPHKNDPNYRLIVHNALENILNKQSFSATLFGYIKEKEYQLDFFSYSNNDRNTKLKDTLKDIRKERENSDNEASVQGILDAPDITKEEMIDLVKQRDEFITPEDIQKINRRKFRDCYDLHEEDDLTYDLVDALNSKEKMKWYHNLVHILGTENQSTNDKLDIMRENIRKDKWLSSCYMEFTSKNTYVNQYHTTNIINYCGFDINNLEVTLPHNMIADSMTNAIGYISGNQDQIAYKNGMAFYGKNLNNLNTADQMKFINKILKSFYGLRIKRVSTSRKNIDNSWYRLTDDNIWECIPRDDKVKPIDIVIREDENDPNGVDRAIEYMINGSDDEEEL